MNSYSLSILGAVCIFSLYTAMGHYSFNASDTGSSKTRTLQLTTFLLLWFALMAGVAKSGFLADFTAMPPRFLFMLVAVLGCALWFSFSSWGTAIAKHISLKLLILLHCFRIIPELLLHAALGEGIAPVQMTWQGYNFDILTHVFALLAVLAMSFSKNKRFTIYTAYVFNFVGLALLWTIIVIALLSAPTPFRLFLNEPANTFVASFPYIWLPSTMVWGALVGHILIFRKLSMDKRDLQR